MEMLGYPQFSFRDAKKTCLNGLNAPQSEIFKEFPLKYYSKLLEGISRLFRNAEQFQKLC